MTPADCAIYAAKIIYLAWYLSEMLYGAHRPPNWGAVPVTAQTPFFLIFNLTSPFDGNSSEHFFLLEVIFQVMFCPVSVPASLPSSNFKVCPLLTGPEARGVYFADWGQGVGVAAGVWLAVTTYVFVEDEVVHPAKGL
jgi:hypothetical protein